METAHVKAIKSKIISGVIALVLRSFLLQIVSTGTQILLLAILAPEIFGILYLGTALISFCGYFSDVGLAAALIQKKEEPTPTDLGTAFSIQLFLIGSIVIIGVAASPFLGKFYHLGGSGVFLIQALLISFFLSSLKTIPSVLLERKLEFKLLVIPQILETLVYSTTVITLAKLNMGINSFSWAAVMQGIVGLITIYIIAPWKVNLSFDMRSAKKLISFGVHFQGYSVLALVKDNLITLYLGTILSKRDLGFIDVAKTSAEMHLRLIMDNIIRVTFPTYSRLQEYREILRSAIEKTLFFIALFIFPATVGLVLYVQPLMHVFTRFLKWEPVLFSFYLFIFSSMLAAFSSPIVNALNSLGKVKISLNLMVMWTVLTWLFVPFFVIRFGFNGMAIASFIISFTGFIPIIIFKKYMQFDAIKSVYKPFVATLVMTVPAFAVLQLSNTLTGIIASMAAAAIVYCLITLFWMKSEIRPYLPGFLR